MNKEKATLQNINTEKNNNPFEEIVMIVENAKERAYRKVNEELILMYQEVGKYISEKTKEASYGSGFVDNVAEFFSTNYPELKGFNRRGLYRMKQFYELYSGDEKVSTLLTQLSWSNHLKIMSGSKSKEEREFYINFAIKENLTHRELVRQMDSGYYERYMLSNSNNLPAIQRAKQETHNLFMDSYVLDLLALAFSTISKILATVESWYNFVTSTSISASLLMTPDNTSSPSLADLRTDSPVMADVSSLLCPLTIRPSRGTLSPTLTRSLSPTLTSSGLTSTTCPSTIRLATCGAISIKASIFLLDLPTANSSKASPTP